MKAEDGKVGFFEMRVRPAFIGWLFGIFFFVPILVGTLLPAGGGKTKARIAATRQEMITLAGLWGQEHAGSVSHSLNTNGKLQVTLLGSEERRRLSNCLYRTNSQGELLDFWKTPIQFEVVAPTNVIIRSAGPNRKFGNKDDIILNSASSSFVKP